MFILRYIFFFFTFFLNGWLRQPILQSPNPAIRSVLEKTIFYRLGETIIPIRITDFEGKKDKVYISLHDDEETAVEAARQLLSEKGGRLIEISNRNHRNIRFRLRGKYYSFDPNGIFSKEGIRKTLEKQSRYNLPAAMEIERFAARILECIKGPWSILVSLHNNTNEAFSVCSYAGKEEKSGEAKLTYICEEKDPDNFFFTTDQSIFSHLKTLQYNCVLQDNEHCSNDGSLSYYCGKNKITYVNCETEHGKKMEYLEMLRQIKPVN